MQYEFEEIKAAIEFDKNVTSNVGWISLFMTPGNRRRMRIIIALAFFSQWSGNGLVYVIYTSYYRMDLTGLHRSYCEMIVILDQGL